MVRYVINSIVSSEQPLPLQKDLINDLGITRTEYTLLLAASTFPNIFFPLFGGWVFDSLGRKYISTLSLVSLSSSLAEP